MAKVELKLDWCERKAMEYAVMNWHYSKRLPSGKLASVGVWEGGKFCGCVVFGRGGARHIGTPYGLSQDKVCELVRVALGKHISPTSKILGIAMKMIAKSFAGIRLIVSYADSAQSHLGIIYQATNWIYAGVSKGDTEVRINGKWCHRSRRPSAGLPKRKMGDKYKYLYPLDNEMRAKILPLAKPYPKRATSIGSDAAGDQLAEGGAVPTVAL